MCTCKAAQLQDYFLTPEKLASLAPIPTTAVPFMKPEPLTHHQPISQLPSPESSPRVPQHLNSAPSLRQRQPKSLQEYCIQHQLRLEDIDADYVQYKTKFYQYTLLHLAIFLRWPRTDIQYMLRKGANINAPTVLFRRNNRWSGGYTPLHIAYFVQHSAAQELLIQSGAITYVKSAYGLTPAEYAKQPAQKKPNLPK